MSGAPTRKWLSRGRLAILVLAVFIAVILATQIKHHNELRLRLICGTRIKSLGTAAKIYAADNGGDLAGAVQSLIDRGEWSPGMAVCPVSGKPFLFAPLSTNGLASILPGDVVVYEPLSYHHGEGANMLFGDGHASFIRADRYADLVGHWGTHPR